MPGHLPVPSGLLQGLGRAHLPLVPCLCFQVQRCSGAPPGELRAARPERALRPLWDPPGHTWSPFSRAQGCRRLRLSEVGAAVQPPCCGVTRGLLSVRALQGKQIRWETCVCEGTCPLDWLLLPREVEAMARA